jgi:hypothetical protein
MSKRTFHYEEIDIDDLGARDLLEEAQNFPNARAFRITIYRNEWYEHPEVTKANALYLPEEGRMGIAWGSDATWADVDDVESGIEMWLNDGETWELLN